MQFLKQSTQVKIRIGPAMAAADGVTPVTTLALGTADEAELLKHNGVATVDISAATFAAVTGCDGWYDLTLTTSHTDTLGMGTVVIQDASLMAPIFKDFMVVPSNVWDSLFGSDRLTVDVGEIGSAGNTTAATNLEAFMDGTGYAGGTTKMQIDASALFTSTMTESYASDGSNATLAQLLYMLWSRLAEKNVSGTTLTAKKLDGTTTSMTFTLDSASAPTSITRAT